VQPGLAVQQAAAQGYACRVTARADEPAAPVQVASAEAPGAAQEGWQPPSEFDQIRELNSQGGRLATLYGFLLTAYIFTAGSEPIRPMLVSVYLARLDVGAFLFAADAIVGLGALALGLVSALATMQPSVPVEPRQEAYAELRTDKLAASRLGGSLVLVCLLALLAVWSAAATLPTGNPQLDGPMRLVALGLTGLSVASAVRVLVRHRRLVRWLWGPVWRG
jgi:hypothetical protein